MFVGLRERGALEKSLSGPMFGPRLLSLAGPFTFYSEIPMSTFTRIAKDPVGMARLVTNYARVKELQQKMSLDEIAEIFDEDPKGLTNFVEYADAFVSGEKSLSLDITTKSKEAFGQIASALK